MAWLGAKVSKSKVSSFPKNTFWVGIFWQNRPHTSFLGLIGYMVRSGAKLFRMKTLLNFASKALSNSFFQKTHFRLQFLYWIAPHKFYGPNGLDFAIRGKSLPKRSFVLPKKYFLSSDFWRNRPHSSFLGLIGYMVRSWAKLFRTKTLLNFASKALSNSFFQKTRFRFEFLY